MVNNPPADAGDAGSIPGLGRSPGERNGNPPQYCPLGNPMDRGAWQATVHEVEEELDTTQRLNNNKMRTPSPPGVFWEWSAGCDSVFCDVILDCPVLLSQLAIPVSMVTLMAP